MADLGVFYAHSAESRGSGISRSPRFTLWHNIYLMSVLTSSPPKSAGKKASLRASSIGPTRELTTGTVLCRYCHSIWSDIPKTAYADWGYRFSI